MSGGKGDTCCLRVRGLLNSANAYPSPLPSAGGGISVLVKLEIKLKQLEARSRNQRINSLQCGHSKREHSGFIFTFFITSQSQPRLTCATTKNIFFCLFIRYFQSGAVISHMHRFTVATGQAWKMQKITAK